MTQLTIEQIDDLWKEVVTDPEHDCSVFGPWFEAQMAEHRSNDQALLKVIGDLEVRRKRALVNLALRRYGTHD